MSDSTLRAWCALNRASGVGARMFRKILATVESPEAFFSLPESDILRHFPDVSVDKLRDWRKTIDNKKVDADLDWLAADTSRHIINYCDARYPQLLLDIPDAPALLFVQGDVASLSLPQISIVGSRNATPSGLENCQFFTQALCQQGIVVTSGLALGIDGCAHQAALQAKGKTIAVVGTGLDRVYPARHYDLAHAITQNGALVSEFPIGTGVRPQHFPQRNRIISGMSLGVLVVEASVSSGSLITARMAAEQGKEVFSVPGSIHNPQVKGCHMLIREGAKLVENSGDILEEILPLLQRSIALQADATSHVKQLEVTAEEEKLLVAMGYDVCRVDDLVERMCLTSAEISAMLTMFELEGKVHCLPGGGFQRVC